MEIVLARAEGAQGPRGLSLSAVIDHTGDVMRDAAELGLDGVELPEIDLSAFGGRLNLGEGLSTFSLSREGDQIDALLRWVSTDLSWTRTGPEPSLDAPVGSAEWAQALVWNTLTGVGSVDLSMGLEGDLESPTLSVSSNLGEAVAASLQRELGQQVADAEARVREEVDRQIQPIVQQARSRVDAVRSDVADRVTSQRQEVDDLRARLDARIQQLVGR